MLNHGARKSVEYRIYALGLVAAFGMFCLLVGAEIGIAEPVNVTILHTNNVTGHLYPCPT